MSLALGGFVAYAGLIVFLAALGCLVGWLLERADLAPMLGAFIGLGGVGLLVIVIGCIFLFKGLRSISRESLAPERTIHTLQELKGGTDVMRRSGRKIRAPNHPAKRFRQRSRPRKTVWETRWTNWAAGSARAISTRR